MFGALFKQLTREREANSDEGLSQLNSDLYSLVVTILSPAWALALGFIFTIATVVIGAIPLVILDTIDVILGLENNVWWQFIQDITAVVAIHALPMLVSSMLVGFEEENKKLWFRTLPKQGILSFIWWLLVPALAVAATVAIFLGIIPYSTTSKTYTSLIPYAVSLFTFCVVSSRIRGLVGSCSSDTTAHNRALYFALPLVLISSAEIITYATVGLPGFYLDLSQDVDGPAGLYLSYLLLYTPIYIISIIGDTIGMLDGSTMTGEPAVEGPLRMFHYSSDTGEGFGVAVVLAVAVVPIAIQSIVAANSVISFVGQYRGIRSEVSRHQSKFKDRLEEANALLDDGNVDEAFSRINQAGRHYSNAQYAAADLYVPVSTPEETIQEISASIQDEYNQGVQKAESQIQAGDFDAAQSTIADLESYRTYLNELSSFTGASLSAEINVSETQQLQAEAKRGVAKREAESYRQAGEQAFNKASDAIRQERYDSATKWVAEGAEAYQNAVNHCEQTKIDRTQYANELQQKKRTLLSEAEDKLTTIEDDTVSLIQSAVTETEKGNNRTAVDHLTEALDAVESDIDELVNAVKNSDSLSGNNSISYPSSVVTKLTDEGFSVVARATTSLETPDPYEATGSDFSRVLAEAERYREIVGRLADPDIRSFDTTQLDVGNQKRLVVEELDERQSDLELHRVMFLIVKAETHFDSGNYQDAREAYETAQSELSDIRLWIADQQCPDALSRADELDQLCDSNIETVERAKLGINTSQSIEKVRPYVDADPGVKNIDASQTTNTPISTPSPPSRSSGDGGQKQNSCPHCGEQHDGNINYCPNTGDPI